MAYLKYSDLPIYANFVAEDTAPVTTNSSHIFAATQASLSIEPILTPNRFLGKVQNSNDFNVTGPSENKFSMTFFPLIEKSDTNTVLNIQKLNQLGFFNLTGDFSLGHQVQFSNLFLKQVYLQNYSIKINAFQPISITANFISYNNSLIKDTYQTATAVSSPIAKDATSAYYESLHAVTTSIGSMSLSTPSNKVNVEINVDCNRTPIYGLGSKYPDRVILNTLERTITIQGESIGRIVDISGAATSLATVNFNPLSADSLVSPVLTFSINGRIVSQQISANQGEMANGKVVIKEIIL